MAFYSMLDQFLLKIPVIDAHELQNMSSPSYIFEKIANFFAPLEEIGGDIDDVPDSLEVTFPGGKKYLILFQKESYQFWISSPLSGGRHFFYDGSQRCWKDTRSQEELFHFFQEEGHQLLSSFRQGSV